ncbi:MAG TPA: HAMP domain-containing sensor histidine kinase [Gammaproteobacteria bacterium]|jgi:signal transduction histidine kinase|nr:HAMP domain-containing sensor histidine kinase [Gammaproteobacteria bacterium]
MTELNQSSLGNFVSKKMTIWMMVLVAAIIVAVFTVSFIQSRQMFLKQVESWIAIAPQRALTSLMDSDQFTIEREVKLMESTGLFSAFCVKDSQQKILASFGLNSCAGLELLPIKDGVGVVWGYYSYQSDFYRFILPFVLSGVIFLILICALYFIIRWRIKSNLDSEFSRFNHFLQSLELLTEKIHEIYQDEVLLPAGSVVPQNSEMNIINRAFVKLIDEIKKANMSLKEAVSAAEKKRFQDELTETALQAAHDIGSPLGVLEATVQSASAALPEDARTTIRNAAAKLRDISYSLLKKGRGDLLSISNESISQHLLLCLINQVVSDKRIEFKKQKNIEIDFEYSDSAYGLFSFIKVGELNRIASNLINNSVESLCNGGKLTMSLRDDGSHAAIVIQDKGKGIPPEILTKVGTMGMTYGKENGNGLGLHHAKTTVESWGGKLVIQSELGSGTVVSVYLPKTQSPAWFLPNIRIINHQTVVVIDDDESIHQLWNNRFKQFQVASGYLIEIFHFYSPDELIAWVVKNQAKANEALYLCDYEFVGAKQNGLDLIRSLNINILSILVTSRYYLDDMIMKCEASNVKLLPKDMAGIIPILAMSL